MRRAAPLAVFLLALAAGPLVAQATPYVPLDDPLLPLFEHLVARGDVADPSPMVRPFRRADAARVILEAERRGTGDSLVLARILHDWDWSWAGAEVWGDITGRAGVQAYTAAGRDPIRPDGPGGTRPYLDLALTAGFDKVVARTRLAVEPRLSDDPAWPGRRDLEVVGRAIEAYGSAQLKYGSVFFGQLDREWGPEGEPGVAWSRFRYPRADFGFELGTDAIRFRSLGTSLRDETDSTGATVERAFFAHRLDVRFSSRLTVGLWETVVVTGDESLFNPFSLSLLANTYGFGDESNVMVGADVTWQAFAATTLRGQLAVDDINYKERDDPERAPDRLALTLQGTGPLGRRLSWGALYTLATSLAFRAADPFESFVDAGVGLGRNADDYDRFAVWLGVPVGRQWLVAPEVTLLRQGEGRIMAPWPPEDELGETPQLFIGTMERTWSAGVAASGSAGSLDLSARAAYHLLENAGHVRGATDHRFEGRLQATLGLGRRGVLP